MDPMSPVEGLADGDIDHLVPPKVMRLTQHLHNLIYIRYFYESIGQQPPDWIKGEMSRAQTVLLDELDREHGQGGAFHKGVQDEAGQSTEKRPGGLENRAQVSGRFTRRS